MKQYLIQAIVALKSFRSLPSYLKFLWIKVLKAKFIINEKSTENHNKNHINVVELFTDGMSLKNSSKGYWSINPMIDKDLLNKYYQYNYWEEFKKGINHNVNLRDLDHFNLIMKYSSSFFKSKKTILNFGSGHLGCSFLFYFSGHKVINMDLYPAKTHLIENSDDWVNIKNLTDLNCEIDFLYSSHSLEHVHSVNSFEHDFFPKIKSGGLLFFEVPNEKNESVKIDIPHTYYFREEYFNNLPFNTILLETYNTNKFPNKRLDNGDVIRYLGKK